MGTGCYHGKRYSRKADTVSAVRVNTAVWKPEGIAGHHQRENLPQPVLGMSADPDCAFINGVNKMRIFVFGKDRCRDGANCQQKYFPKR